MRKSNYLIILSCIIVLSIFMFGSCGSKHTHDFGDTYFKDSTYHWKECSCGEKTNIANHDFSNFIITDEPTEESEGVKFETCVVCDQFNSVKLPKLEHEYVGGICKNCYRDEYGNLLQYELVNNGTYKVVGIADFKSTNIIIPNKYENSLVTEIEHNAFSNCNNIENVTIMEGITIIGSSSFANCENLTSINIPSSVTDIESSAFLGCSNLRNINFDKNAKLNKISNYLFYNCNSLSNIEIPANVLSVETSAFEGCSSLMNISFEEGSKLTTIGEKAFYNCSELTSIEIPDGVTNIGFSAFEGCDKIERMTTPIIGNYFSSLFGTILKYNGSEYVPYSSKVPNSLKEVKITNVEKLEDFAFYNCNSIEKIEIPANVASIGRAAFYNCSSLKEFDIPYGILNIWEDTFYYCSSLESINIPSSVKKIDQSAFSSCYNLKNVFIENESQLEVIMKSSFSNCNNLQYNIYNNGKYLGNTENPYVFLVECLSKDITSIVINANVKVINQELFFNSKISNVIFEEGIQLYSISESCFYGCGNLTSIVIPEGVNKIEHGVFYGCINLTSIVIPSSVTSISNQVFSGCNNLTIYYVGTEEEWLNVDCSSDLSKVIIKYSSHAHKYSGEYNNNSTYHWNECYCGEKENINIHNYGSWIIIDEATEETVGSKKQVCGVCGYENIVQIPKLEHTHKYGNVYYKDSTHHWKECPCGEQGNVSNHTYGKWIIITEATEETVGSKKQICTTCDYENIVEIPLIHIHKYVIEEIKPTCEEDGYTKYSCKCGDTYIDSIVEALGHTVVKDEAVIATCEKSGLTEGSHCSVCDKVLVKQEIIEALGHIEIIDEAINPTCTTSGLTQGSHCSTCSEILIVQEIIDPINHSYDEVEYLWSDDCNYITASRVCKNDSTHIETEKVTVFTNVITEVTCEIDGILRYTSSEFENQAFETQIKDVTIPKINHFIEYYLNKEEMTLTASCVCQYDLSHNCVEIVGVSYVDVKAPTCEFEGIANYISNEFINDNFEQQIYEILIPELGHTFVEEKCKECGTDYYSSNLYFTLLDDESGYSVSIGNETSEIIIIPQKYKGLNVKKINENAFSQCSFIKKIIIPNSVIYIGKGAFEGCESLEEIRLPFVGESSDVTNKNNHFGYIFGASSYVQQGELIPDSLLKVTITNAKKVANYAFAEIYNNIKHININSWEYNEYVAGKDESIGFAAFKDLNTLEYISIPFVGENVFSTSNFHFGYIFGAKSYYENSTVIPQNLTKVTINRTDKIAAYAFYECNTLESINICDTVFEIPKYAFANCSNLENIEFPQNLVKIEEYAFSNCSKLKNVELPKSVTNVGKGIFEDCNNLSTLSIPFVGASLYGTEKTHFGHIFGADYSYQNRDYVPYNLKKVIITNDDRLYEFAFESCNYIEVIIVEDSVTYIETYAFYSCQNLLKLELPGSVTKIEPSIIFKCYNIDTITLPFIGESKNDSANYRLAYCYSGDKNNSSLPSTLNKVTILSGEINSAFSQATISHIVLGNEVINIGESAFAWNSNLTTVEIASSVAYIGNKAFYNCRGLTNIEIPNSVTSIGENAFNLCISLSDVIIPNSVTSIGNSAFYQCSSLNSIILPNSVTYINDYAFANNSNLISITFEEGSQLLSIGEYVFRYCKNLTNIIIPSRVTSIGKGTFYGCTSLASIIIKSGLTSIKDEAFSGCTSLTSIEIPTSVTSIGEGAFYGCTSLASIEIPTSVTSIGKGAFYGCNSLTSIEIPTSVTSIGEGAFYGCNSLKNVYYTGTQKQWNSISIAKSNWQLTNASITYNYKK